MRKRRRKGRRKRKGKGKRKRKRRKDKWGVQRSKGTLGLTTTLDDDRGKFA